MGFDEAIERRGTNCTKWDMMEPVYGVSPEDGIAMWVADMDFRPPQVVQDALQGMLDHGVYGYSCVDAPCKEAIRWWMAERHGWEVDREAIFSTHGLVNGTAMCIDAFTAPKDGVVLMTPVYHAFARVIKASGRRLVELPLAQENGRYVMDFAAWEGAMTGGERMLVLCSPHNPGGRVWTREELRAVAEFCVSHDLILVSDEIHHDLVLPGQTHVPMALAAPEIADRLVMMTAATKTFNIAGAHVGNVIVAEPDLRARFARRMAGLGLSPNAFGLEMTRAAYSPEGAAWVDQLMGYLQENMKIFDEGIAAIPGVRSMPMEATYLAWVDFADTGMSREEFTGRVERDARLAVNHGPSFGTGGETFLRFNLATPRARVEEAVERLRAAFADLQ